MEEEKCILGFGGETLEERDHSDDPVVNENIMLEFFLGTCGGRV